MADADNTPSWATPAAPAWAQQQAPATPPPEVPLAGGAPASEAYQAVGDKLNAQTQPGRMGAVVNQAFGLDTPVGLSPDAEQHLRDAGIFDDYKNGQVSFIKQFNEAIIRPAAVVGDTMMRALNAALVLPVGTVGAAMDAVGIGHEDAQTNAYHAQDFADYVYMTAGMTPEGLAVAKTAADGKVIPPMPPSAVKLPVIAPKPWQAEIPAAEEATKEAPAAQSAAPITNLPAIKPGEKAPPGTGSLPSNPSDPIPHENPIVDGTGNLNLNFIRADQDTKDVMGKVAEAYDAKYGTSIPHAETEESARAFMDEATTFSYAI